MNKEKKIEEKISIFTFNETEWTEFLAPFGYKPYRGRQIRVWLYEKFVNEPDLMSDLPVELRALLNEHFFANGLFLEESQKSNVDGSEKFLWKVELSRLGKTQTHFVESVLIRHGDRQTACISSQIGCRVGCSFCKTRAVKPVRNLPEWAIVEQYWQMCKHAGLKIGNIVFMGMGEPFHNYRPALRAAHRFCEHPGIFHHPKRITISTSGVLPMMEKYLKDDEQFRLAVSLNAATSDKRQLLIPHEKRWPIEKIADFADRYYKQRKKRVTLEYVMIRSFNDSPEEGKILGKMFARIPVKVNVIPYNETDLPFKTPTGEAMDLFIQAYLREVEPYGKKSIITIRRSAGTDISGACGQLAGTKKIGAD